MKDTSKSKRLVIICPPLKKTARKVRKLLENNDFQWVYLGESVARALALEQQLTGVGKRLEIAEELQKIASLLWQPYIDYIGRLSLENNSIWWWVSSLPEKNPWVSKTFLYTCYIRLFQTLLDSGREENLVFWGENKALRECLAVNITPSSKRDLLRIESPVDNLTETLKHSLGIILYKGYFIVRSLYRLLLARYYRRDFPKGEELVLLQNWVDQRSFDANGNYRDSYLGGLANHLRNKGKRVIIVPHILPTVPYRQTLKKMTSSEEDFLVPEASLKITDIRRVLVQTMNNPPVKRTYPSLDGMDISAIIADDFSRDRRGISRVSSLLLYEAVKHWQAAGIPIDTFIYAYENQVWEKAYCLALREFYPKTRIIGYQHATVPKMLLNYFFSRTELTVLPFPDRIITTGKYTEKLFKKSGYESEKVVCGGAIRYASLLNRDQETAERKDASRPVILVTPSIDKNETLELGWKVLQAFGRKSNCQIIFKFHPDCSYHRIARDLGKLPEHFIVSDRPVSELLPECNVLLYTSSATSIEALSRGIPVLHIKSDFIIDRDNLSDFPDNIRPSAQNADTIVKAVEEILKKDERELSEQKSKWQEFVAEFFEPVDERVFDLFR